MLMNVSKAEENAKIYTQRLSGLKSKIFEEIRQIDANTRVNFIKEDIVVGPAREKSVKEEHRLEERKSKDKKINGSLKKSR